MESHLGPYPSNPSYLTLTKEDHDGSSNTYTIEFSISGDVVSAPTLREGKPARNTDSVVVVSVALPKKVYPGAEIRLDAPAPAKEFFDFAVVTGETLDARAQQRFKSFVSDSQSTVVKISLTRENARKVFGKVEGIVESRDGERLGGDVYEVLVRVPGGVWGSGDRLSVGVKEVADLDSDDVEDDEQQDVSFGDARESTNAGYRVHVVRKNDYNLKVIGEPNPIELTLGECCPVSDGEACFKALNPSQCAYPPPYVSFATSPITPRNNSAPTDHTPTFTFSPVFPAVESESDTPLESKSMEVAGVERSMQSVGWVDDLITQYRTCLNVSHREAGSQQHRPTRSDCEGLLWDRSESMVRMRGGARFENGRRGGVENENEEESADALPLVEFGQVRGEVGKLGAVDEQPQQLRATLKDVEFGLGGSEPVVEMVLNGASYLALYMGEVYQDAGVRVSGKEADQVGRVRYRLKPLVSEEEGKSELGVRVDYPAGEAIVLPADIGPGVYFQTYFLEDANKKEGAENEGGEEAKQGLETGGVDTAEKVDNGKDGQGELSLSPRKRSEPIVSRVIHIRIGRPRMGLSWFGEGYRAVR
ncbi:hypothetical protein HK102_009846, partial [Quaeritorhiza haematococci]